MAKQDDFAKFQARVPQGLRDQLEAAAAISGRSMNAELVKRLEDSFLGEPERLAKFAVAESDAFVIELRGGQPMTSEEIGRLLTTALNNQRHTIEHLEVRIVSEKLLESFGIGVESPKGIPKPWA